MSRPGQPGPAPQRPGTPGPLAPGQLSPDPEVPGADRPEPAAPTAVATAAAERLARLDGLPVTEHVAVFDEVHRLLQDALATLDQG